jgi:hypothetical protein
MLMSQKKICFSLKAALFCDLQEVNACTIDKPWTIHYVDALMYLKHLGQGCCFNNTISFQYLRLGFPFSSMGLKPVKLSGTIVHDPKSIKHIMLKLEFLIGYHADSKEKSKQSSDRLPQ